MRQLDGVRGLRMVVLDACRDNPFQQRLAALLGRKSLSGGKGFVAVKEGDLGQRTVVAFAAREGTTAQDRPGWLSTYTEALVKHIETPGLEVRLLLGRVRDHVLAMTTGQQQPHEYGSLGGQPLYLAAAPPGAPAPLLEPPLSAAAREWQDVKGSSNRAVLEAFRKRHAKDLLHAELADEAIAKLAQAASASAPAVPTTPAPAPAPPTKQAAVVRPASPSRCTDVEILLLGKPQCVSGGFRMARTLPFRPAHCALGLATARGARPKEGGQGLLAAPAAPARATYQSPSLLALPHWARVPERHRPILLEADEHACQGATRSKPSGLI